MKICIISMEYPPYPPHISAGGVGTHTYYLSRFLARRGHDVHVIACGDKQGSELIDGVHVYRIKSFPFQPLRLLTYSMKASERLFALNQSVKFDIVHNQSPYGFFETYLHVLRKSTPIVTTIHAIPQRELMALQYDTNVGLDDFRERLRHIILKILANRVEYRESDKIIAVSNSIKRDLKEFHGIREEKISVIQNGVDIERFKISLGISEIRKKLELGDSKIVLYVGRLIKRKGPKLLIQGAPEITKRFPTARIVLVGTGYFGDELKRIAERFGKQIVFANRVSDELLPFYYAAADVVALPSLYEGAPITLLEAMASAKPIVTTNIPSMTDVVGDTAITVSPNDTKLFIKRIIDLLQNEQSRQALGNRARLRVFKCFTWEKVAEETEIVYKETINETR